MRGTRRSLPVAWDRSSGAGRGFGSPSEEGSQRRGSVTPSLASDSGGFSRANDMPATCDQS